MDVFNIAQVDSLPVTAAQLEQATRQDPVLSKVFHFTKTGWPDHVSENLKSYWNRRHELTTEGNCVMWGLRVILPKNFRHW